MIPEIVAHRGDAEHFPENSLPGLESAWRHGVRHVEFDVQLSADGVPFLIHDASLARTTRSTGDVRFLHSGLLDGIDAGEPSRFGGRHACTRLPRLAAAAALMAEIPASRAFVELKRASLVHHGRDHCVERVLAALAGAIDRCILISFDAEACRLARATRRVPIGLVLDAEPGSRLALLEDLRPEYVFSDYRLLARSAALPGGPWTWVSYEVEEAALAVELGARGVTMVESMAPLRLKGELADAGCLTA